MKRLLIATTAVMLVGSTAYAEVNITGDARMGLKHDSSTDMDFRVDHRFRVIFSGSGTTDNGLGFSAGAKIDSNQGGQKVTVSTVSVSGGFGKLIFGTAGEQDPADLLGGGVADLGYDGVGVDDVAEKGSGRGGTSSDVRYEQTIGNIKLAATFGPVDDELEFALGMSFAANGITVGAGFDSDDGMTLGGGYALNEQLSFNAFYGEEDGNDGLGGDLTYGIGATTLTVAFATNSDDHKAAGIGLKHNLGGGAELVAGFGQGNLGNNSEDSSGAEIGLTFTF